MKCTITDPKGCLNCPYSDCIASEADIKVQEKLEVKKNGKRKYRSVTGRASRERKQKEA